MYKRQAYANVKGEQANHLMRKIPYTIIPGEEGKLRKDIFLAVSYTHLDVYKRQLHGLAVDNAHVLVCQEVQAVKVAFQRVDEQILCRLCLLYTSRSV